MLKISRKGAEIFRNERRGFIEIFNFKIPKIIYKKTSPMKSEAFCLSKTFVEFYFPSKFSLFFPLFVTLIISEFHSVINIIRKTNSQSLFHLSFPDLIMIIQ